MTEPSPPEIPSADRVRAEVERISANEEFARAPVMRRLLAFLVEETLAGRGAQLKAYAVAVDGLGRAADFDAAIDSYPRVQVGRLRKMLDAHYRRVEPEDGVRLSIPPGRYRVLFDEPFDRPAMSSPPLAPEPPTPARRNWPLLVLGLAAVLAVALFLLLAERLGGRRADAPPILEIGTMAATSGADAAQAAESRSLLLDGLARAPLLVIHDRDKGVPPGDPDYRLTGELSSARRLRLRLWQGDQERLIWSWQTLLPPSGATAGLVAPALAELAQPYGVIATRERIELNGSVLPGYPCLLQFDGYRRARTAARHARVRACLEASVGIERARAYAYAALSLLAIDERLYGFNPERGDPAERALALARLAVAADPFLGRAHQAMARSYFAKKQWPEAARSARQAAALAPLDPDLLALMAAILANIRAPDAAPMARRALALDPNAPASFYAPLVYVALLEGDGAAARAAVNEMVPSPGASAPLYDLVTAVVRAGDGDRAGAQAAWRRLTLAIPEARSRPRAAFERWDFAPPLQAVAIRALEQAGLVPPQPRAVGGG